MENTAEGKQKTIGHHGVFARHWFSLVFVLALILSVGATAYRVFAVKSYFIELETVCSPETEACFAWDVCDTEDGFCGEEDVPIDTEYYKYVERPASAFPAECASGSMEAPICADLSCLPGESDCTETFCGEETAEEGDVCVGPGYSVPEPIEESMEGESADASDDTMGEGGLTEDDMSDVGIEAERADTPSIEGGTLDMSVTGDAEESASPRTVEPTAGEVESTGVSERI